MRILVTGGAGYIGSITTRLLLDKDHQVTVLDSLENGYRQAVPKAATFIRGSTHDQELLAKIFTDRQIEAVIHFAAYKVAGESVKLPGKYFSNNTAGSLSLLEAMAKANVKQLVFSSTAAVYGNPKTLPANESLLVAPENPYGESKALVERIIPWFDQAYGLKAVMLRYFNVAGAWPDGSLGEDPSRVECLIPLVLQVAAGKRPTLNIYGHDYSTKDGTAVRDYIHVVDLAEGHLAALDYLAKGGVTDIINLGTGQGNSVQEVVDQARKITGQDIPTNLTNRRPGDPTAVWAANDKAKKVLGWQPRYGLTEILQSAWRWQTTHPQGFAERSQ
jgi:UDP-glucose 4-epimerase